MKKIQDSRPDPMYCFLSVLLLFFILRPYPAKAAIDPPGPPKIKVDCSTNKVILIDDPDDGIDGKAEFILTIRIDSKH